MKFKIAPCKDHSKHDHAGLICIKIRHKNTGAEVLDGEIMEELERLEAELAESNRVLAIHKRDYEAHFKAHQEELAKREMALESLESIAEGAWLEPHSDGRMMIGTGIGRGCFAEDAPELAEWLSKRGKS